MGPTQAEAVGVGRTQRTTTQHGGGDTDSQQDAEQYYSYEEEDIGNDRYTTRTTPSSLRLESNRIEVCLRALRSTSQMLRNAASPSSQLLS